MGARVVFGWGWQTIRFLYKIKLIKMGKQKKIIGKTYEFSNDKINWHKGVLLERSICPFSDRVRYIVGRGWCASSFKYIRQCKEKDVFVEAAKSVPEYAQYNGKSYRIGGTYEFSFNNHNWVKGNLLRIGRHNDFIWQPRAGQLISSNYCREIVLPLAATPNEFNKEFMFSNDNITWVKDKLQDAHVSAITQEAKYLTSKGVFKYRRPADMILGVEPECVHTYNAALRVWEKNAESKTPARVMYAVKAYTGAFLAVDESKHAIRAAMTMYEKLLPNNRLSIVRVEVKEIKS